MKKIVAFTLLAGCSTSIAIAQNSQDTTIAAVEKVRLSKYITMQNGKMIRVQNGNTQPLANDIILPNGTTIMTTGTVKSIDGSTTQLKEGERLDMEGKLIPTNDDPF